MPSDLPVNDLAIASGLGQNSGNLSWSQIANLARRVGFPEEKIPLITAISLAESNGNPNAFNPNDPHGGSFGITQINGVHPGAEAARGDPLQAMKLAYQVSDGGQNFRPWSTFTSGAYKSYLQPETVGVGGGPGLAVPRLASDSNALAPSAPSQVGPTTPAPDRASLGNASLAGAMSPLGGPWARLLGLSLLAQGAKPQLPQVRYDPRFGMTDIQARPLQLSPSPLGNLGGMTPQVPTSRFSAPQVETPRVSVDVPAAGASLPRAAPYVTRIGMRDFWNE